MERLLDRGFLSVTVTDPFAPDLVPEETLREETRSAVVDTVQSTFRRMETGGTTIPPQVRDAVDGIIHDIESSPDILFSVTALRNLQDGLFDHSANVCAYAIVLAASMGHPQSALREIGLGALLHDIGKIYFMDLVRKRGKLSPEEYERIREHAEVGFRLLSQSDWIRPRCAQLPYQHHERFDGSGYPRGLAGDEIDPWARMVAISDVYDSMTADRVYGNGLPPHAAAAELQEMARQGKLDRPLVRAFLHRVAVYPEGSIVIMESGELGVVSGAAGGDSEPTVRILTDADLNLVGPFDRLSGRGTPETTIRTMLLNYPPQVLEQIRLAVPQ